MSRSVFCRRVELTLPATPHLQPWDPHLQPWGPSSGAFYRLNAQPPVTSLPRGQLTDHWCVILHAAVGWSAPEESIDRVETFTRGARQKTRPVTCDRRHARHCLATSSELKREKKNRSPTRRSFADHYVRFLPSPTLTMARDVWGRAMKGDFRRLTAAAPHERLSTGKQATAR